MQWFKFFLSHSIFVSFCAVGLSYQSFILLRLPIDEDILILIFSSTLASYNFYWLIAKYRFCDSGQINLFFFKNFSNILFFFIASLSVLIELYKASDLIPFVFVATLLTFLYSIPLLPIKRLHFLCEAGFLKTFILAFTWSFVTVLLPAHNIVFESPGLIFLIFIIRFSFMQMLVIIFDTRDIKIDQLYSLHSLATDFPSWVIKIIMISLFVLYNVLLLIFMLHAGNLSHTIALASVGIATIVLYVASLKNRGYYFYYFIIDGLMLFSALATFLATI